MHGAPSRAPGCVFGNKGKSCKFRRFLHAAGSDAARWVSSVLDVSLNTSSADDQADEELRDSYEGVNVSLTGFCVYREADVWCLVVLLSHLEYHLWSSVCKTAEVRGRFASSEVALAAACSAEAAKLGQSEAEHPKVGLKHREPCSEAGKSESGVSTFPPLI